MSTGILALIFTDGEGPDSEQEILFANSLCCQENAKVRTGFLKKNERFKGKTSHF